ncbi:MAG: hypothetical protein GYB31_16690 [Bacteroidetes bacterium]|nr:hypothetical protein [Bacteroidota bacterium]
MKRSIQSFLLLLLLGGIIIIPNACVSDQVEPKENALDCESLNVNYTDVMQPIITETCSYAGCHVVGSGIGDFSTYEGILPKLESGQVQLRVFESADMPPAFVEEPERLTDEERDLFSCWLENGFPKS